MAIIIWDVLDLNKRFTKYTNYPISAGHILENNDYTSRLKVFSNVVLQRKYQVRDSLSPKSG